MSEQATKKTTKKTTTRTRKPAAKAAEEKKEQAAVTSDLETTGVNASSVQESGAPDTEKGKGNNKTAETNNENGVSDNAAGGNENVKHDPDAHAEGWEVARVLKVTKPLMKGDDVKALQAALIARNYHCGTTGVDGVYGKYTAYAVRCFQSANRLVVDGKAGRYTVAALGGVWKG